MFNSSIFVFIFGWVLWFLIDKQPFSLGTTVPDELDTMLDNFQLSFDILKAGFLKASFVFIWKAHYIILSVIGGLLVSIMLEAGARGLRRRHLRDLMWPGKKQSSSANQNNSPSDSSFMAEASTGLSASGSQITSSLTTSGQPSNNHSQENRLSENRFSENRLSEKPLSENNRSDK